MYVNAGLAVQLMWEPHSLAKPPWRKNCTKNTKEHPSVKNETHVSFLFEKNGNQIVLSSCVLTSRQPSNKA